MRLCATATLTGRDSECGLGELFHLRRVQFHRAVFGKLLHQLVRDLVEDENLFLADAQKIVVKRRAGNNRLRRARQATGVVHQNRRIARPRAYGAFAGLHCRFHYHRPASDEQQAGVFVFAEVIERIQRRLLDDARDVLDTGLAINRLVVGADRNRRTFGCAGMRIEDNGISRRANVHDVAAQRGNGMGAGRDRANDAERRVFFERDAVVATARVRPQPVHAGHQLDDLQLRDLVIEPTNLGLIKFNLAPGFGIFLGERLDDLFNLAAARDAFFFKL